MNIVAQYYDFLLPMTVNCGYLSYCWLEPVWSSSYDLFHQQDVFLNKNVNPTPPKL